MGRRTLRLALVGTFLAACDGQGGLYGDVEICRDELCTPVALRPGMPAKLCTSDEDLPPAWASAFSRARLRIVVGVAEERPSLSVWVTMKADAKLELQGTWKPRGYCRWGFLPGVLCPDCSERPCKLIPEEPWGRPHLKDVYLPPSGGCVYVHSLPEGVVKVQARFENDLDWKVPLKVGPGVALVLFHQTLRMSVPLHATIGGSAVLACIILFVAYWIGQQMRKGVPGVPFSGLFSFLTMVAMGFSSWFRQVVFNFFPVFFMSWSWVLEVRDPFCGLPIGWIIGVFAVFVVAYLVIYGAKVSMDYFASPEEPEGEVPFDIGEDGRRIDILPPTPWPQYLLGWSLWASGAFFLLTGTNSDVLSAALLLLVLLRDRAVLLARDFWAILFTKREVPGTFVRHISPQLYQEQGATATQQALWQLSRFLEQHPDAMSSVSERNELRLRRFSAGGPHFHAPEETFHESRTSRCSIQ